MVTFCSWKEWFLARESASAINKGKQGELFKVFDHSVPRDQLKVLLQDYEETVFMFRQDFGEGKVSLFHHLKSIGGTIYSNEDALGFIQGIGEKISSVMTPDFESLSSLPSNVNIQVPTVASILAVSLSEDIQGLAVGGRTS